MDDILTDKFVLKLSKGINPENVNPAELSIYLNFTEAEGACAAIGANLIMNQRSAFQKLLSKYVMKHGRRKESALMLRKIFLENEMKDSADLVKKELEKFDITVPSDQDTLVDPPVSLPTPPSGIIGEEAKTIGAASGTETKLACKEVEAEEMEIGTP